MEEREGNKKRKSGWRIKGEARMKEQKWYEEQVENKNGGMAQE